MSEVQKPVEEPVAPVAATTAPVEATPAAVESTPVEAAPVTEETPAAVAEPVTEEAAPVKEEVKPVEEGILGYKGPGLFKGLIFQKKFLFFGSEPVEQKSLASYVRGEKPEVANHNVAWASSTGKGLLFLSKKATEKATPSHIFNLSEISEVVEQGTTEFHFTEGGHKYTFEATTLAERDNWVSTLKTKVVEAKEVGTTVKDSEAYKTTHSALTKPIVAAVVAPKKEEKVEAKEEKKEEKAEAKEEKKEEVAAAKEEKKEEKIEKKEEKKDRTKSRSASRKRASIFGSIPGFGSKKEDKVETKEEPVVAPAATTEATPAPVETAPVEAAPVTEEVAPAVVEPVVAKEEPRPKAEKRGSIFGSFLGSKKEKKPETEAAPAVPVKDAEPAPVSETAPVIPAVEETTPLEASVASPATVPTTETTNGVETKAEAPVTKSEKRKSSLPFLSKKEKATTSDEEGEKEKPLSPFAKLRQTVKGKSSPKAEAKSPVEKTPETAAPEPAVEAKKEETTPAVEEPKTETTPLAATPQVATTA